MSPVVTKPSLDNVCINTIRFLAVDAVQNADSGHPGLPLDAAPMAYVLWTRFLKHNPKNPKWWNRDRFVLSAGHGSALLYSLLYLAGYDLSLEDLKQFRQWNSKTPGHPERERTLGVEVTTGPLGQGFANGVGMAIAEASLASRYNQPGFDIMNHYTYGIVSDGDLMEGVASEAASLAGHLKLGKLIYLYDSNHITLSASTQMTFTENVGQRFEAYGWHVHHLTDGNNLQAIEAALRKAQAETNRPSLIIVRTHIGYGSPHKQDTFEAHGSPLGEEEVKLTKKNLDWPTEPLFYVPEESLNHFRKAIAEGQQAEVNWKHLLSEYTQKFPDLAQEFQQVMKHQLPIGWDGDIPKFSADWETGMSTRVASGKVLNIIAPKVPQLMGGSADLNPSTHTALQDLGDFEPNQRTTAQVQGAVGGGWSYMGRNMAFGVREHAMGAISSGMAAHGGIIPYCATFFNFSDYMRPVFRLAAMMKLQVIYVFTHDSIGLGEDGPTHEPIEQLISLRAIPNLTVIRPCDANETTMAWQVALESKNTPTALVLTRQKIPILDRTIYASADNLRKGAYILAEAEGGEPQLILIATGSEVHLIVQARKKLQEKGIPTRIVSMPSWELFEAQSAEYKNQVLPPGISKKISVEAGSPLGWCQYVGPQGSVIGVSHYGASAPGKIVMEKYGFTVENICQQAEALLKLQRKH